MSNSSELVVRILALEPYFGGSHRAFLEGWSDHSKHTWTVLGLRPSKWKWRMRHAALTFASQLENHVASGQRWDMLFCSDMLNLAEFRGLAPEAVRGLPTLAYFHENQLTYPVQHESERDFHFGFTNMTTALAATAVWFNSAFNRDSFLTALPEFLKRMPDYQPVDAAEVIRAKSSIQPQGIKEFPPRGLRQPGPLHIVWAARWEHDKDPDTFFDALRRLVAGRVAFRVSVIGEQFRRTPPVFESARAEFGTYIDRWGYQPTREAYRAALMEADVFVSTAQHEFFGISAVEAMAAGAYPLLPDRLAYPELLNNQVVWDAEQFFYQGDTQSLTERLAKLARRVEADDLWQGDPERVQRAMARFTWPQLAPQLDTGLDTGLDKPHGTHQ
ncbi:MAG: DUF3524 domain-containing protein [Planctomycetota bacterium]